jgi:hypothetical protein
MRGGNIIGLICKIVQYRISENNIVNFVRLNIVILLSRVQGMNSISRVQGMNSISRVQGMNSI